MLFCKQNLSNTYEFLIVGLGNPGKKYENTRHNIGFITVDILCNELDSTFKSSRHNSLVADVKIGSVRCLICKPLTFMNLSGASVSSISSYYKIPADRVIVVFDDISLDTGRLRIRKNGSAGGHNGIKDIIAVIGDVFPRVKIGVGSKPHPDFDLKNWVLSPLKGEEKQIVINAAIDASAAVKCIVLEGCDSAMNKYNR